MPREYAGPRSTKTYNLQVRISQTEYEQVRQDADAADMTISAYIRSLIRADAIERGE